ncbi:MAG: NAD(P)-dependent oxidoreductase, partial [Patescibacteria group bacterium]
KKKVRQLANEKILADIDVLVVKLNFKITKTVINKASHLKLIATSTTGLNHIDVDYAQKKGISVLSLRGHADFLQNIYSTAEHTLALILALIRKIPWSFQSIKEGRWQRELYYGREIYGKTLGILGYGRLGKIVSLYGQNLGLKVIAHDPYVAKEEFIKNKVRRVSFKDLFKQADILSVHVLLTPDTNELVKEKDLRLMKPTSFFINTARGEIIEESALVKALKKEWIAGAAIDVMTNENPDGSHLKNNALVKYAKTHDNLLITSHIGGATFEAMQKTEEFMAQKIKEYAKKL